MITPRWIQRELKLIHPMYFAIFNPHVRTKTSMSYGKGRWQIRKWIGAYPKKLDLWDTSASKNIMTICKETYNSDKGLHDTGYEEIDMRVIYAIRKSHWWKLNWKEKIADMDWRNEKMERDAIKELDYQSRHISKLVWRKLHEPTVILSGKEWKV